MRILLLIALNLYFVFDESFKIHRFRCLRNCLSVSKASSPQHASSFPELERCLYREYTSFFNPFEKKFYRDDVEFRDPLNSFRGVDKYQNNVDLLAGKTMFGSLLFEDASIVLHKITQLDERKLETRWTLQVTAKMLPWKPRAKFTGISVYTLDTSGKVASQQDYWDSVNLKNGKYSETSIINALADFTGQLKDQSGAQMAAPECPYELLRRANRYEVRRYPAFLAAETPYNQRPEGYDRLGSYAGGSNVDDKRIPFLSPTLMRITGSDTDREKVMTWPLIYSIPGKQPPVKEMLPVPTIPNVSIVFKDSIVVAVTRFELAATEPNVRGYTKQLLNDVKSDNLIPKSDFETGVCVIGQFDALFSLNKRRNEVWVELDSHPWLK